MPHARIKTFYDGKIAGHVVEVTDHELEHLPWALERVEEAESAPIEDDLDETVEPSSDDAKPAELAPEQIAAKREARKAEKAARKAAAKAAKSAAAKPATE